MPVRCTPATVNQLPHIINEALHKIKTGSLMGIFSVKVPKRGRGQMGYTCNKTVFKAALLLYLLGPLNCIDYFLKKVNLALKHFVY